MHIHVKNILSTMQMSIQLFAKDLFISKCRTKYKYITSNTKTKPYKYINCTNFIIIIQTALSFSTPWPIILHFHNKVCPIIIFSLSRRLIVTLLSTFCILKLTLMISVIDCCARTGITCLNPPYPYCIFFITDIRDWLLRHKEFFGCVVCGMPARLG